MKFTSFCFCTQSIRVDLFVAGAISPAISMHPGMGPHLQQLQEHLLRSSAGRYQPLLTPLHNPAAAAAAAAAAFSLPHHPLAAAAAAHKAEVRLTPLNLKVT